MRGNLGLLLVVLSGLLACGPGAGPSRIAESESALQELIDGTVRDNPGVPAVALHLDSPLLGLDWEGAAGLADPAVGRPMHVETPVRIASNTKTYVAAAVLRLWERGKLGLDDPIATHLPPEHLTLLRADGYDPGAMTLRHLLTHTSGLFEHAGDEYAAAVVSDPTHRWTRTEQLTGAVEWGDPYAAPGEIFTYSDTGYILLGAIVERVDGKPIHEAVRDLVGYGRLGMNSTWWESLEPRPADAHERAHQLFGEADTFDFDPSFDLWGGGGVVATVGDLARFWRGLFSGGIYEKAETLETMLSTVEGADEYRMGLWESEIEGFTAYSHTGFWGTVGVYIPELDLVLTITVNQNEDGGALAEVTRQAVAIAGEARPR